MQDKEDGVTTLSYLLGYRGTFMFTAIVYALAMVAIGFFFNSRHLLPFFYTIQLILAPVLFYFTWWFLKVYKDPGQADFKNTMRMNIIGSVFTNAAFIYLFISQKF
jgi:1,4-dihydroxy-2-naphthoate octaprenyltransferase